MDKSTALHEGLKKMLTYLPIIYNQRQVNSANTGVITIRYPYASIPNNAIIFVLPLFGALQSTDANMYANKLKIEYATTDGTNVVYNVTKTYNIMVEGFNGTKRPATLGDIVPNRLCMFRFISGNTKDVILCNNPIYNNLSCSTLYITDTAKFNTMPVFISDKGLEKPLALEENVTALEKRVLALEKKFVTGTETAEEYFSNNPDAADGTFYMQVEE